MSEAVIDPDTIAVSLDHGVPTAAADYARLKLSGALAHAPARVLAASVRISREPHHVHAVVAAVNVDLNGKPIHVDVTADAEWEAIDLLEDRLRNRLAHL